MSGSQDDSSINDDELLWRRVPYDQITLDDKGNSSPSSKAFQDSSKEYHEEIMAPLGYKHEPGMSSALALQTTVDHMLRDNQDDYIVEFTTGFCRENSQGVLRAPLPDDTAHVEVIGKKTKGVKRNFARHSKWVKSP